VLYSLSSSRLFEKKKYVSRKEEEDFFLLLCDVVCLATAKFYKTARTNIRIRVSFFFASAFARGDLNKWATAVASPRRRFHRRRREKDEKNERRSKRRKRRRNKGREKTARLKSRPIPR
jgi:hypothetical protein